MNKKMDKKISVDSVITFIEPEYNISDDRGYLKQLVSSGWNQTNLVFSKKNTFRGGHFHKNNDEVFFIINGTFELSLEKNEKKYSFDITPNDMFIIHKNASHSFDFKEDCLLISFYDKGVLADKEIDIHTD